MPKHAVNTSEQARIRKLFQAGNSATAIAAHMNIDVGVVESFHPDNVAEVRERNRHLELEEAEHQAEEETRVANEAAQAAVRSERARKAAATRAANQKAKREAAKEEDKRIAEEREAAQKAAAEVRQAQE